MKGRSSDVQIDLFPFLSILVCMMGVLTLLITGIVLSQIAPEAVAVVVEKISDEEDLSDDLKKLDALFDQEQSRLNWLNKKPVIKMPADNTAALMSKITATERQIADRKSKSTKAATEADRIQSRIDELQAKIAELKPDLEARNDHIAKLEAELAKRKGAKKGPSVRVLPAGSGFLGSKIPIFADCDKVSVSIHVNGKQTTIQRPQLAGNPEWKSLLGKAATNKNYVVVFLVRRDGIGMFNYASRLADSAGVTTGKIPVAWDGDLDLSLFQKGGK